MEGECRWRDLTRNEIAKVLVLLRRQVHVTAKICLFNRLLFSYWLFGYFPVPDSRLVLVHQSVLAAGRCCSLLPQPPRRSGI